MSELADEPSLRMAMRLSQGFPCPYTQSVFMSCAASGCGTPMTSFVACVRRKSTKKVVGTGTETEPDPTFLLPKASQADLHPDATTLALSLHVGFTIRMVR